MITAVRDNLCPEARTDACQAGERVPEALGMA
jgi:hypothetical protein